MSSKAQQLAEAIVERLNDPGGYSLEFEAEWRFGPFAQSKVEEDREIKVTVFVGSKRTERRTRGGWATTYKPVVGIQSAVEGSSETAKQEAAANLLTLVEEIEARLRGIDTEDSLKLTLQQFDSEQDREWYNPEALQLNNFFASAIELTFTD